MKIVLAFDSFKGCMTAEEACRTAAQAIHEVLPDAEVVERPLSDGGEGLVNCVKGMLDVNMVTIDAHDPLMNSMKANYAISADGATAYMEMAETSGLPLVPMDKRNPLLTTTYGVGDMIADATRRGCKNIIMGIGGSATCDAGMGMLNSLADHGVDYDDVPEIIVACDVTNPLYGENGAAYIFGPQKGATPEQVKELDERLRRIAHDMESIGIAKPEDADIPGAGAAGGLGYGLLASLHATLKRGIDIVLDINDFNGSISDSTLIITGEGKSDEQTLMGKVPYGVLNRAKERNIPVWLLSGCIDDDMEILSSNFTLVRSINEDDDRPLDTLMQTEVAKENLAKTIRRQFSFGSVKALFFDIDGTLVSFKTHEVPQSTIDAIHQVRQKGIKVFIATGRPMPFINNLSGLEYDGIMSVNGASCITADGKVVCNKPVPKDDIERIIADAEKHPMPVAFAANDKAIVCNIEACRKEFKEVFGLLNLQLPESTPFSEALNMEVMQVIAFFNADEEPRIMRDVLKGCDANRWHPYFADCIAKGTSKATGIDEICRYYGIDISETMAFGDGGNDIAMLQHAGIGVAMGNAPDEVKQYADIITDTVDNDGIAKILQQL